MFVAGKLISAQGGIEIIERFGFRTSWKIAAIAVIGFAAFYCGLAIIEKIKDIKRKLRVAIDV